MGNKDHRSSSLNKTDSNIYLKKLFPSKVGSIHVRDLVNKLETVHGHYLSKLIQKEWEIIENQDHINKWEAEHGNDLAQQRNVHSFLQMQNQVQGHENCQGDIAQQYQVGCPVGINVFGIENQVYDLLAKNDEIHGGQ